MKDIKKTKILLATTNASKVKPFLKAWQDLKLDSLFELVFMDQYREQVQFDVEEDTGTFEGDARKKALQYSQAVGIPTISLDRGIEFAAFPGWPGTDSKEVFHGSSSTIINFLPEDAVLSEKEQCIMRSEKLIRMLDGKDRTGFSVYGIALALPNGEMVSKQITINGTITEALYTDGVGYNYDWFFIPEGLEKTLSMLTKEEYLDFTSRVMWPIPGEITDFLNKVCL